MDLTNEEKRYFLDVSIKGLHVKKNAILENDFLGNETLEDIDRQIQALNDILEML